jgi:hypothetical protein
MHGCGRIFWQAMLRAYPNNPLYPQGKPDACVVGEKTFSTQLDMKDTTLSNGVNVEQTTPGEHFWPAALASNSAIGGQVFARPHNDPVIRLSS